MIISTNNGRNFDFKNLKIPWMCVREIIMNGLIIALNPELLIEATKESN